MVGVVVVVVVVVVVKRVRGAVGDIATLCESRFI